MAELIEAVILISIIFLMGLALGIVATVIIRLIRAALGPPKRPTAPCPQAQHYRCLNYGDKRCRAIALGNACRILQ